MQAKSMISTKGGRGRVGMRLLVAAAVALGLMPAISQSPAAAAVTAVEGSAFGYYVNVGLFGGPRDVRGFGQEPTDPAIAESPSVALPPEGSATPITDHDPDGAAAQYGPAVIFGGQWPDDVASPPPSGPMTVSTQGTPEGGSVTSSTDVTLHPTPVPVRCVGDDPGTTNCTSPGGIGPGPLIADRAQSTCTATEAGVTGSATFTNGIIDTKYDESTQLPIESEAIPLNPPPNYTVSGTIDHVGDSFTIVLNEQIIGPDSITVNAAHMYLLGEVARGDMVVGSSTCSLTSDVPNGAPVANDDAYTTAGNTPLTLSAPGLLANDTDPDGDPLTATHAQSVFLPGPGEPGQSSGSTYDFPSVPDNGTVTFNPDGSFTYTPDLNFNGTDTFDYVAHDPRGANDTATVTITVAPLNEAPVAGDDAYRVNENNVLTVAAPGVLANDTDGDGDPLTAGSASDPANGTVSLASDGSFTYTPDPDFVGTDSFTYVVDDGTGLSDTGTVTITVAFDEAVLLKDIFPGTSSSSPGNFTQVGSTVFFAANDGATDTELWKTDGSAAGTVLVKDIDPGLFASSSPSNLTEFNGALYFSASNGGGTGQNGTELWRSDGTPEGTVMVKDINPGTNSSSPSNFTVIGESLYFAASNGFSGTELWKSDGTEAGTVMVKDILPGGGSSSPRNFEAVGTTLFFTATNGAVTGANGTELWKTDGTAAGTVLVKDINPGTASSNPAQLQAVGTTLFFSATTGTTTGSTGTELWKSDGTEAGTVLVKDINPGTASSTPSNITVFGDIVLFSASNGTSDPANGTELWKSDGTEAGTVAIKDIRPGTSGSFPGNLRVFGDSVLFSANDGTHGTELWKTDGTEAGTVAIKDINPGTANSNPTNFTVVGDLAYFSANDGIYGIELWRTDGTEAGTVLSDDINPGPGSSFPATLTPALGSLFFSANDGATGVEPHRLTPVDAPPPDAAAPVADFDGDGDTDRSVYRPSNGMWFARGIIEVAWGTGEDVPVPADYDGDRDTDVAVFRPSTGEWFVQGQSVVRWGTSGDVPVPADYDNDGAAEVAVFRPSTGEWFVQGQPVVRWGGVADDVPVPGDYDNDGAAEVAVFRPSTGEWFVQGQSVLRWGTSGDVPVPGDYDADGDTDVAVYRPSTGQWFVPGSPVERWGIDGDIPLPLPYAIRSVYFPASPAT